MASGAISPPDRPRPIADFYAQAPNRLKADEILSLLDLVISPSVLIGTVIGAMGAVAIGKLFPEHDLSFFQALVALAGFVVGIVLDLAGKSRQEK